jgi:hypothetical protein
MIFSSLGDTERPQPESGQWAWNLWASLQAPCAIIVPFELDKPLERTGFAHKNPYPEPSAPKNKMPQRAIQGIGNL